MSRKNRENVCGVVKEAVYGESAVHKIRRDKIPARDVDNNEGMNDQATIHNACTLSRESR
jgi:hypothetical protein